MDGRGCGRTAAALLALGALLGMTACSGGGPEAEARTASAGRSTTTPAPTTTAAVTTTVAPTTTAAPPPAPPPTPPHAAADPAGLAAQLAAAAQTLRDPASTPEAVAAAAWLEQVAYRQLGDHPEWDADVLGALPVELQASVQRNTAARREFRGMATKISDTLPAWRIVDPLPAEELLGYYQEAEASLSVPWNYLAAINLVETGMGRIVGLSVSGAQGPMQFMPSTWEAFGDGGDVNNARDAVFGAARYLVHNGFTEGNVEGALFRYNNHPNYVRGVIDYAEEMAANPTAFTAYYHWQIYYLTTMGDVFLPVGYESPDRIPVADYLATHPQ